MRRPFHWFAALLMVLWVGLAMVCLVAQKPGAAFLCLALATGFYFTERMSA